MKKLLGTKKIILSIGGLATTIGATTSLVAYKKTDIKEISSNQDLVKKIVKGDDNPILSSTIQDKIDKKLIAAVTAVDLNLPSIYESLGSTIDKPSNGITASGVAYTFSIWTADDDFGEIAWEATLTKGRVTGFLRRTIPSFSIHNPIEGQSLLDFKVSELNLPNSDYYALPSTVSKPNDGITSSEVAYNFVDWITNDYKGTIDWSVNLTEGDLSTGQLSKNIHGTIHGYGDIITKLDRHLVNEVNVKYLISAANNSILPSTTNKPKNGTTHSGVAYKFTTWTTDDVTGTITLRAILTKGKITRIVETTILGYLTSKSNLGTDQKLVDVAVKSDLIQRYLNMSGNSNVFASNATKPSGGTTPSGVSYEFTTWTPENGIGTINWIATLSKGKATHTFKGTTDGYLTSKSNLGTDQKLVDVAVKSDLIQRYLNMSGNSNVFASNATRPVDGITSSGVTYKFTTWTPDDTTGTINSVVVLSKGETTRTIKKTITGYWISQTKVNTLDNLYSL